MIAVYCATSNYFGKIAPAVRSLLMNNPGIETVYLITDKPTREAGKIKNIVTEGFPWISRSGPNYYCRWTYMSLIRLALHRILPDVDRCLYLDCDTIVCDNIEVLDELSLYDNVIAGVREPAKSQDRLYVNAGVLLMDLKALRSTGLGDALLQDINSTLRAFPDQDCINDVLAGHIYELPTCYNMSDWTGWGNNAKIIHYAAYADYQNGNCPHFDYYEPYSTGSSIYEL